MMKIMKIFFQLVIIITLIQTLIRIKFQNQFKAKQNLKIIYNKNKLKNKC